jgi:hypothetical protein
VAHVDLALTDLTEPGSGRGYAGFSGSLDLWSYPVSVAAEPCLLVDAFGVVIAVSPGCAPLLGVSPQAAVGRRLVGGVLHLLDFSGVVSDLPAAEADKIPPVQAATTGGLARHLIRVQGADGLPHTVDAVSVPLRDGVAVVGSLTFFASVSR